MPNQDIAELRAQSVGTDSAGGYSVPQTMLNRITERMKVFGGIAAEAETITTESGAPLEWPSVDDTQNSAVIAAEGTASGSGGADIVFGTKSLGAYRYVAPGASNNPLLISKELLADSAFDIQSFVIDKLATRIARAQAVHWVNGTGSGQPDGITTNTTTTTTFTTAAIDKDDLIAAMHDVDPEYGECCVGFSDSTLEAIRKLEDSQGRPLWLPQAQSGLETAIGGTLFGHRVVIDQAFSAYADDTTNKWGVFGDVRSGYVIRRVQDVQVLVNPYTNMGTGQVAYWTDARADGTVNDAYAYTVLKNAEDA
ncbi:phage major capsid protein [Mycolicibacterium novocastrense]|uniref:phage major capsid protein n=1 Tax=Mycolicibacterium novocastrense TaxID=59813 RepID=UPI001F1D4A3B|nr:phage major capsid protein [Mycolicibacterium novocastrense]